jgi:uncharacterized glyoxalase superfamily protein PhnB
MPTNRRSFLPRIFPVLAYRDVPAAIDWLTSAFGFEQRLVVPDDDGTIMHAELSLGSGTIMLGTLRHGASATPPRDEQSVYIAIPEVDAHHARAKAAGADILREPTDMDYDSREYSARDPEGHVWHFGTYLPGD